MFKMYSFKRESQILLHPFRLSILLPSRRAEPTTNRPLLLLTHATISLTHVWWLSKEHNDSIMTNECSPNSAPSPAWEATAAQMLSPLPFDCSYCCRWKSSLSGAKITNFRIISRIYSLKSIRN